jgi:hypothetical protein
MERFIKLQIYATRSWAAVNAYPQRRIGLAWSESTADGKTTALHQRLALSTALALQGAYSEGGTARFACDPINGMLFRTCNPSYGSANPPDWSIFGNWP